MENVDYSTIGYTLDGILEVGVYLAHLNNQEQSIVAVQTIDLPVPEDEQNNHIRLLQRSITPVLEFKHMNVVKYYGFRVIPQPSLTQPAKFVIFMEYCQNRTLWEACTKGRLPLKRLQSWTKSILEGLNYLHEKTIVHRNIKASNIFLSDEVIKIGGLTTGVRLRENMTMAGEVSHTRGSANHMSPEMILAYSQANMKIGRRTDIWSLGCTVIEMLTGQKLQYFRAGTGEEITGSGPVMNFVAHGGKPFYPTETPVKLRDFLEKCFTFDYENRPRAHELLKSPFIIDPID